jgi:hypothetical protein
MAVSQVCQFTVLAVSMMRLFGFLTLKCTFNRNKDIKTFIHPLGKKGDIMKLSRDLMSFCQNPFRSCHVFDDLLSDIMMMSP